MSAWGALICALQLDSVAKSSGGFANHAQTLPLILLALVAISPLLEDRRKPPLSTTSSDFVALAAIGAILPYSYIGLQRVLSGGWEMFTGDVLLQYLSAATASYQRYPPWVDPVLLKAPLNAGFAVVTAFEVTSVCLLLSRKYRCAWLLTMLAFHITTLFAMNVFFWENLVLITVIFWWNWSDTAIKDGP